MEFGEIIVYVVLILPLVVGAISASKGISKEDMMLPCAACKSMIPATAKACPYCRRSAGHDLFSKKAKAQGNNSKGMRFLRAALITFGLEILFAALISMLFK